MLFEVTKIKGMDGGKEGKRGRQKWDGEREEGREEKHHTLHVTAHTTMHTTQPTHTLLTLSHTQQYTTRHVASHTLFLSIDVTAATSGFDCCSLESL